MSLKERAADFCRQNLDKELKPNALKIIDNLRYCILERSTFWNSGTKYKSHAYFGLLSVLMG